MSARSDSAGRGERPLETAVLPIDFGRSIPPVPPILGPCLSEALINVTDGDPSARLLRGSTPGGTATDREAGARWLAPRHGLTIDPTRLLVTSGTQCALTLLLRSLVAAEGIVLAEELSYSVIGTLVRHIGYVIKGVAIDADGIIPESFEEACRTLRPRALYCNPTVHNPTTAVMPLERRMRIADIARRYGLWIFEDDVLGLLHPEAPPPIAAVAPDVTWSVHGTTKCLAHGLRLAYLVGPDAAAVQRLFAPVSRLSYWFASSLSAAVMRDWIDSGRARRICDAIRQECIARERLAVRLLAGADVATKPGSFHAWVTLPPHWPARDFVDALRDAGVLAREAGAFAVEDGPVPNAVRLSLSSPDTLEDVAHGLGIVAKILFEKR